MKISCTGWHGCAEGGFATLRLQEGVLTSQYYSYWMNKWINVWMDKLINNISRTNWPVVIGYKIWISKCKCCCFPRVVSWGICSLITAPFGPTCFKALPLNSFFQCLSINLLLPTWLSPFSPDIPKSLPNKQEVAGANDQHSWGEKRVSERIEPYW